MEAATYTNQNNETSQNSFNDLNEDRDPSTENYTNPVQNKGCCCNGRCFNKRNVGIAVFSVVAVAAAAFAILAAIPATVALLPAGMVAGLGAWGCFGVGAGVAILSALVATTISKKCG